MKWFRLYNEIIDDAKVAKMTPKTFKFFIFLLCISSELELSGDINLTEDELSWRLRMPKNQVKRHLKVLEELEILVTKPIISLINWDKRQYRSDSSKERVKRYRNKKCNVTETPTVTPPDTEQNRDRTEQIQNRAEQNKKILKKVEFNFNVFWKEYPKKKNIGQAKKTWKKLLKQKTLPDISILLKAIAAQKTCQDWQKDGGQYIPHPSTWLNAEGWEDEVLQKSVIDPNVTAGKYSQITADNIKSFKKWSPPK